MIQTQDFDYVYPPELIATAPLAQRDQSKMMVLNRHQGTFEHRSFREFSHFFQPGDILVFNNTKVLPARLWAFKKSGGKIEVLFLKAAPENPQLWTCLLKPVRNLKTGDKLFFKTADQTFYAVFQETHEKVKQLLFPVEVSPIELMRNLGKPPIPPYMARQQDDPRFEQDQERYQTIFAQKEGAVAAPTAGLHFTPEILDELRQKGVELHWVTLHVGLGTFEPIRTESIEDHVMHEEYYEVSQSVAQSLIKAKQEKRPITAVGTTSVRALESYFSLDEVQRISRDTLTTRLFIKPGYAFKMVDRLFTNFHQPQSTLIILASAFAGKDLLFRAYQSAIEQRYRLFSYGDAMLVI